MKLVKPNAEFIPQEAGLEGIYKQIERCGRVCYKSEDKITDSSAEGFVERMIKSNHTAMLEHGTVYLYLEVNPENAFKSFDYPLAGFTAHYNWSDVVGNIGARYRGNPYSKVLNTGDASCRKTFITTNYRVLVENEWLDDLQFLCEPTKYHAHRYTVKFTTDIGVCREILRHRKFSFANESTRYCNYGNTRFDGVTFIIPSWWEDTEEKFDDLLFEMVNDGDVSRQNLVWGSFFESLRTGEKAYMEALALGWKPEQARQMLPLATKTELIATAFKSDWYHFFTLRLRGTTGRPHPDMKRVASLAFNQFVDNGIIDLIPTEK